MNTTIRQMRIALEQALERLHKAAGNDPFISQADLAGLLASLEGAEKKLVGSLYLLAKENEQSPRGRVTKADLERLAEIVDNRILPEFELSEGGLSKATEARLSGAGEAYLNVAAAWKAFAQEAGRLSAEELTNRLELLVKDLVFNNFVNDNAAIEVSQVPGNIQELTTDNFLQTLEASGNQDWQGITDIRDELLNTEPADDWLNKFPGYQEDEATETRANHISQLIRDNLVQTNFMRFDFQQEERTRYYVAGLAEGGSIVFLEHNYIWT